jgi:aminoglycoside phosphotransferase family enzyme/predicted kinase
LLGLWPIGTSIATKPIRRARNGLPFPLIAFRAGFEDEVRLMELARLMEALSQPSAYPEPPGEVQVRQTHISVVFLAGRHAYKIKKPVALGFLDFRTVEARRHFCTEEVRLNRRLAPAIYQGVVPVTRQGDDLRFGGEGEAIEWAVQMERLPEEATLLNRLRRRDLDAAQLERLAQRIAAFHAAAQTSPRIAAFARFEAIADNVRDNLSVPATDADSLVRRPVLERLRIRMEETLARLCPRIESRAARGMPRDTHGDLRLEHIYLFPDKQPPDDLVIVDCIEFNERFRYADPVADMAFVVMDLMFEGRRDLARTFADAYFRAAGDGEGRELLPLYTAYRSTVRAKVDGIKSTEAEIPESERASVRRRARAHWLLALGELEQADRRPCLVLVAGLPGSGKSTLARGLAERTPFHVLRSDVIRKELVAEAGIPLESSSTANIYTPEWTANTYAECLHRTEEWLFAGERVLVDATFREESWRRAFLEAAVRWGVPAVLLLCRVDPDTARARLERRRRDVSDADWQVYLSLAQSWQEISDVTRPLSRDIASGGSIEEVLAQGLGILRAIGLHGEDRTD